MSTRVWRSEDENGNSLIAAEQEPDDRKVREYRVSTCFQDSMSVIYAHVPRGERINTYKDAEVLYSFIRNEVPAQTYRDLVKIIKEDLRNAEIE